ncbi:MAG: DMT family transporter [Paracoccaceae bacterium]
MTTRRRAALALLLGGALWGVVWIPLRALGGLGLEGAWPSLLLFAGAGIALLPLAAIRCRRLAARALPLLRCGLLTGAAIGLYAVSISLTEIARAVLLFYLTPVWGALLGALVLGERLGPRRLAALALGLSGLAVVLGIADGPPLPRGAGDWLALGAGLAWAFGSLEVHRLRGVGAADQVLAFTLGALVVSGAAILLGGPALGAAPPAAALAPALGWSVLAALYLLPTLALTLWPAQVLPPARVGLILMSEVVVGLASAALLTEEPFGLSEGLGALLIVSAAVVELSGREAEGT